MSPQSRVTAGKASLFGGIIVGIASFVLWTAIARDLGAATAPWLATGVIVSAAIGVWIRKADL
jgi:uncharacterized membrane protein YkvI